MTDEKKYAGRSIGRWVVLIVLGVFVFSLIQVVAFRFFPPPGTPLMAYRWLHDEQVDFRWRPLSEISPFLQCAVIAAEDQKFLHHSGFDWEEIERAFQEYREKTRRRGASTITMQVAKNLYLWHDQSWLRKGLEAYYTVLIELLWPKWRIMEVYLNIAEWGVGVFGAEAAADRYFQCTAAKLAKSEAALLAAVLPSPRRWSPNHPTQYIRERKFTILRQMDRFTPVMKMSQKQISPKLQKTRKQTD